MKNIRPNTELAEFAGRGIEYMLEINKNKCIPWRSLATVAVLGSLQIISGILMIPSGVFALSGIGLIAEGAFDLFTVENIWRKRRFSWSNYLTKKAVILAISLCTFGLGKFIDGGSKGFWSSISKRFNRKALEQAWNLIVKAIRERNLQAIRQAIVTTSRVFAREGLSNLVDFVADLPLQRLKPEIFRFVQKRVKAKFCNDDFNILIGKMYALDKMNNSKYLAKQINNIISKIIGAENEINTGLWHSFVSPLCKGILSDFKVIGSWFKLLKRIRSSLDGLFQIAFIIDSIYNQLIRKISEIDKEELSIHKLLHKHKEIPLEEATEISQILKSNDIILIHKSEINNEIIEFSKKVTQDHFVADFEAGYFFSRYLKASPQEMKCELINPQKFTTFPDQEQSSERNPSKVLREINFGDHERYKKAVENFCKDLNEFTQNPNSDDLNATLEIISEKITEQIIRVTESHLISPWSSLGIKVVTKKAAFFAEKNWVIDQSKREESKEINKNLRGQEAREQEQKFDEDLLEYGVKKEIHTENYLSNNNHQSAS